MSQLALPLQLADHAVFDSFWPAGNENVVAFLKRLSAGGEGPGCWLFGPAASGKTHLLQATCEPLGDRAMYLPMSLVVDAGPAVLEGIDRWPLVCLDDVQQVAGNDDWEQALFALWHRLGDAGGILLVAATASVRECGFALPDLQSRFAQLTPFQLAPLPEPERAEALKFRARHRGLELPDETATYLLKRSRRDMASLYSLLDHLDAEALRAQRRLTIPFVRSVVGD